MVVPWTSTYMKNPTEPFGLNIQNRPIGSVMAQRYHPSQNTGVLRKNGPYASPGFLKNLEPQKRCIQIHITASLYFKRQAAEDADPLAPPDDDHTGSNTRFYTSRCFSGISQLSDHFGDFSKMSPTRLAGNEPISQDDRNSDESLNLLPMVYC